MRILFTAISHGRRGISLLAGAVMTAALTLGPVAAHAETSAKLALDWVFEGSHAPFADAVARGLFKSQGLSLAVDRGYGTSDTLTKVASGAYDFGYVSLDAIPAFNAQNPKSKVVCVFVIYDSILNTVTGLKSKGIRTVKDLEGKQIAAAKNDDGTLLFEAFAAKAHIDPSTIHWVTVQPNLRDTMLARGQADGMVALSTARYALMHYGVPADNIVIFPYADALPDIVGRGIIVSEKTAEEKPALVKAFVRAMAEGTKDAAEDPAAAVAALTKFDPLIDTKLEAQRFSENRSIALLTPNVREHGLSYVTPERLRANLRIVANAFKLSGEIDPADLYTDRFLPPRSDLMVKVKP